MYCLYYQAQVMRDKMWFLVGSLRSESNLVFERALKGSRDTFEFFVPPAQEPFFLEIMQYFISKGYVQGLERKENRLINALQAQHGN